MKTRTVGLLLLLTLLLASGTALASAVPNQLNWYVFGGGGGHVTSTHYGVGFTMGQTVVGTASSTQYSLGLGFWPGIGIGAPPGAAIKLFLPVILRNHSTGF